MYRHILVPSDGTPHSKKAIATATRLAATVGARLTAVHVIPPYRAEIFTPEAAFIAPRQRDLFREHIKRAGMKSLATVQKAAREAGLDCAAVLLAADSPWAGILRVARARKCDLIVMASHGRRGLAGLLLGSETNKVLTHSRMPVLVCR